MAAIMTRCPPVGDLERLLADGLSGPERDSVETHVEMCTHCQIELARLSATTLNLIVPRARPEADPELAADFLQRLRQLPVPRVAPASRPSEEWRPPAATTPDARFPGKRIGRYEIIEKLAVGGMGVVFKARHVELDKVVALKVLPAGEHGEAHLARFKNEMRAIGRLSHPHIVAALDAGDADGVHYLAMDFVDGIDLSRLVRRHERLPVADACEAIRQAAMGLQQAFEHGLVHRDIKPSNIMLARSGIVRLLDLGLARASGDVPSERLTETGALLGTADYLAPEQWDRPQAVDVRADVYGLGCTLYHLLAGRPPFVGDRYSTMMAKMRAHHDEPPPPIGDFRPDVPPGLAAVADRMLAKDPSDRFATPAEVVEALRPFAAGANLVRLIEAEDGSPLPPAEAAVTPGPASLETSARTGRRRKAATRRGFASDAVLGFCLLFLAGCYGWSMRPLTVTNLRVTHYRDDGKLLMGELHTSPEAIRVNDSVALTADFNKSAHYYLIAFNPTESKDEVEQLCSPEGATEKDARVLKPVWLRELRYPHDDAVFKVDAVGLQVFVLAASTKPLPPYQEWRAKVGDIPWTVVKDGIKFRWHSDGTEFTHYPRTRGPVIGAPKALSELRDWFKARPEFDVVQIFAFPVID
jgi:serine/threonine protein kinase